MKGNIRSFASGCIVTAAVVGLIGTAAATIGQRTATLNYANIKVELNGQQIDLVDANGQAVEPFTIDGTTYLPVRAVSNALGMDVAWDQTTSTVNLTKEDENASSLSQINNLEVRSIEYLDQISQRLYSLGWRMTSQVNLGANNQNAFDILWNSYINLFGLYDEQNDYMPESTYDYQYKLMDEFESIRKMHDLCVAYCTNPTMNNYNAFLDEMTNLQTAYDEMQDMIANYYVFVFPVE